ncbi:MAG: hypothetical protein Q4F65_08325 [Propionibacteriaceae bacterium]|nr:hypothetical protein [Propionibacteriaceae bacterium]
MRIGPGEAALLVMLVGLLVFLVMNNRQSRPAAEVLESIFGERSTPTPGPKARVWALGVLHEAGVDPDADPVYAMKVLRTADRRLNLVAAKVLVDTLNRA